VAADDLTQTQRYLGEETVHHAHDGIISRRDMMVRLVGICGSVAAANALLLACGDDKGPLTEPDGSAGPTGSGPSGSEASGTAPATSAAGAAPTDAPTPTAATPPTTAGSGPVLGVAATDPAVHGEDVMFMGPAGRMFGHLVIPTAGGRSAGVIVIHEIFGLNDHIRDVSRRLAKAGYRALAVDLTSRAGGVAKVGANGVSGALGNLAPADMVADLDAGAEFLASQRGHSGKLGVVGFCFGGGATLRYAANSTKPDAAVAYYGPTPDPVAQMADARAPILAHYGATDARVNAGIDALESTLRAAGKTYDKHVWDGAGHAFNNDTGGAYNEAAAVAAWTLTLGWFAKYLAP
jgi:carboxymethylenebutenolidase